MAIVSHVEHGSDKLVGQVAAAGFAAGVHGNNGDTGILGGLHQLVETGKLAVSIDTGSAQALGGTAHDHDQRLGIAKVSGGGKVVGGELHVLLLHNGRDHLVVGALATGCDERGILGDGLSQTADLSVGGVIIVAVFTIVGAVICLAAAGSEAEYQHGREQQCENFLCHNSLSPFHILCDGRRLSRRPKFCSNSLNRQEPCHRGEYPHHRAVYRHPVSQHRERRHNNCHNLWYG